MEKGGSASSVFLLILLVGLGSAMAISPTVRAAVINFVKEVFQNQVIYRYTGISNDEKSLNYQILKLLIYRIAIL